MRNGHIGGLLAGTALLALLPAFAAPASPITRVNIGPKGVESNNYTDRPAITTDGGKVIYRSSGSNLVPKDSNGCADIFVYDVATGTTERVNASNFGALPNGHSDRPAISEDGGYLSFMSMANNLVPMDDNGDPDIFVRDVANDETHRVNLDNKGRQSSKPCGQPAQSPDGLYVAFVSDASELALRKSVPSERDQRVEVYLRELTSARTYLVTELPTGAPANGDSSMPSLSRGAKLIAYASVASNLVPGDTNGRQDVFLYDFTTKKTVLVSQGLDGKPANGPATSPMVAVDGSAVVFASAASNLVPNDTNGSLDIFRYEVKTKTLTRVNTAADGAEADDFSDLPGISPDGQYVCFRSAATNLVPGDSNQTYDIFVKELKTGKVQRVSLDRDGKEANGFSTLSCISAGGKRVVFVSDATNLVPNDKNGTFDVFLRELSWK